MTPPPKNHTKPNEFHFPPRSPSPVFSGTTNVRDHNMPSKGLKNIPSVPQKIASVSTARQPYYCTTEFSTPVARPHLNNQGASDKINSMDTSITGVVQHRRRFATAFAPSKEPPASVVKFPTRGSMHVGLFQQGEIVGGATGPATAHCLHPSPVAATTTDTSTLYGTATTGTGAVQRRDRPATWVDVGKRPPARSTGMPLETSGSGIIVTFRNDGTTRPPPPYEWDKKKEHAPVQDAKTPRKQGMGCGGSKEGGGNGTVKRRRRSCLGSRGHGMAAWICFNQLVRLLLVLVCSLGVVEGFAKLPNGDGNIYSNAGTLRGVVSDWVAAGGASSSTVVATYGPIEDWDVSEVTNMKYVFYNFGGFNADLSKWNTSTVTNMDASKCTLSPSLWPRLSLLCILNIRQLEFHRITLLTRFVPFVFVFLKRYSFLLFVVGWSFLFFVAPSLLQCFLTQRSSIRTCPNGIRWR